MLQGFLLVMSAIIALCAVVTVIGFIVNMIVEPVKADVKDLQKGQARLEDKLDLLLKDKA